MTNKQMLSITDNFLQKCEFMKLKTFTLEGGQQIEDPELLQIIQDTSQSRPQVKFTAKLYKQTEF